MCSDLSSKIVLAAPFNQKPRHNLPSQHTCCLFSDTAGNAFARLFRDETVIKVACLLAGYWLVWSKKQAPDTNTRCYWGWQWDLKEAESELVGRFMTEHAAVIFVFFFLAVYTALEYSVLPKDANENTCKTRLMLDFASHTVFYFV
jgi:hypothetical protein